MEREYTITIKVKRTYSRKVNRADKLAEVRRAIAGALPDGWAMSDAKINLKTTSAKSVRRAEAKRERAKEKRAEAQDVRRRKREIRKASEKAAREWERNTYVDEGFPPNDQVWVAEVLERERMVGWHVFLDNVGRMCWWYHSLDMPPFSKRVMNCIVTDNVPVFGAATLSRLRAAGCGVSVISNPRLAFLHEVAHYRRWQTVRRRGDGSLLQRESKHNKGWMNAVVSLVQKYCPEAFTEEARAMESLREMK